MSLLGSVGVRGTTHWLRGLDVHRAGRLLEVVGSRGQCAPTGSLLRRSHAESARLHGCGGVREGGVLANHHVICLEPPLRFTPQHSTVARLQSTESR